MDPIASLTAANAAFVGSHFAMSHPLRAALVRTLGERGFMGVYSLVHGLASRRFRIRAAGPGGELLWNGSSDAIWIISSLLTILSLALLFGSLKGNPALPETSVSAIELAEAGGAFAITRHPMMWAFAIWAISHILVWPSPRTLVTAAAMGLLALLGAHLQDHKKEQLLGEAWRGWEAKTSYWPRWAGLGRIGRLVWLHAIAAWLLLTWLHVWLAGIPAGIWRWLG